MKEPRPAMISARPPESRSSVANCWKTRIGSSELRTLTALVSRIVFVRAAAAPSTTAGSEDIETDLVRELDLLDQVVQPLCGAYRPVGELCKGVNAKLDGSTLTVR